MTFGLGHECLIWGKLFQAETLAALKNKDKSAMICAENTYLSDVTAALSVE